MRANRPALHAGWLAPAAFLDLARVVVANQLLPTDRMHGWSLPLLAAAGVTLWMLDRAMHGNVAFVAAATWGLVPVAVKQRPAPLAGGQVIAVAALALAAVLAGQSVLLRRRGVPARVAPGPARH